MRVRTIRAPTMRGGGVVSLGNFGDADADADAAGFCSVPRSAAACRARCGCPGMRYVGVPYPFISICTSLVMLPVVLLRTTTGTVYGTCTCSIDYRIFVDNLAV